jgi:hypothetical protein
MKVGELRKLKAGTARAALVVLGVLGLAFAGVVPVWAQEAEVSKESSGPAVTAYLDYQEVSFSFANWGAAAGSKAPVFKKEPALSGSKVVRGTLQFGANPSEEMGFAWDRSAGKLYLDLNRNLDLTDDPVSEYPRQRGSGDNYQCFANIHLPFKTPAGSRQMLADINLYYYGRLSCSVAMRSFWQGKVTLQGEEWQVGLLGSPFDRQGLESGQLLLRPWTARSRPFNTFDGSLDAVPFSRELFVNNHAYQLRCTNEIQNGTARVRMQFSEQQPKLGELKITGQFVQRMVLEAGPYLVVLDKPGTTVKVPVGHYGPTKVCLAKGDTRASLDGATRVAQGRIDVNETTPTVLTAGGPLTNSVSVNRRGKYLALNYELLGAGGAYQLVNLDRSHPPEFTIYKGDKKVASGKFEFG